MTKINILNDGTTVFLKNLKQSGIIVGATIRQKKVTYEIGYYSGSDYRVINLNRFEFDIVKDEGITQIGYK